MATINVTDATFEDEVLKSDKPVLVKATAKWCGPCKAMAPTLEEIAEEMKDQIKIYDLDIDENPITPTKYGVRGIPTMLIFKNGQETPVGTKVGAVSKGQLVEFIEQSLKA